MVIHNSVLDMIGNTPLVDVSRLSPNPKVRILGKMEGQNPGGSVKDRIARSMVLAAEADGTLTPGKRILFLTKDPDIVRRQLRGELDLKMADLDPADLRKEFVR